MMFQFFEAFLQMFPYTNPSIGHVPYDFFFVYWKTISASWSREAIFPSPSLSKCPKSLGSWRFTKFWWWLSQRWILVDCGETYLGDLGWAWMMEKPLWNQWFPPHTTTHTATIGVDFGMCPTSDASIICGFVLKWWYFKRKLKRGNFPNCCVWFSINQWSIFCGWCGTPNSEPAIVGVWESDPFPHWG